MLICQDITRNASIHRAWITKYRRRGYIIVGAGDEIDLSREARAWERHLGDHLTWILPHERTGTILKKKADFVPSVSFEVLPAHAGVAGAGAAIRIGPPSIYSAVALLATGVDFGQIRNAEIAVALLEYN
ncbi:hypothetical protein FKP32DRAFT_1681577 [Trametes sanguinea]|nr:hypothetical protein FKP32DRAFT_1681577 [Trametes sanguinea]